MKTPHDKDNNEIYETDKDQNQLRQNERDRAKFMERKDHTVGPPVTETLEALRQELLEESQFKAMAAKKDTETIQAVDIAKEQIRSCFNQLVEQLRVQDFNDKWYQEKIVEYDDVERINSECTSRDKASKALHIIMNKPGTEVLKFITCLREDESCSHLVKMIDSQNLSNVMERTSESNVMLVHLLKEAPIRCTGGDSNGWPLDAEDRRQEFIDEHRKRGEAETKAKKLKTKLEAIQEKEHKYEEELKNLREELEQTREEKDNMLRMTRSIEDKRDNEKFMERLQHTVGPPGTETLEALRQKAEVYRRDFIEEHRKRTDAEAKAKELEAKQEAIEKKEQNYEEELGHLREELEQTREEKDDMLRMIISLNNLREELEQTREEKDHMLRTLKIWLGLARQEEKGLQARLRYLEGERRIVRMGAMYNAPLALPTEASS